MAAFLLYVLEAYAQSSSAPRYEAFILGPRTELRATAINDKGQITGSMAVSGVPHVFLWENGVFTDLGLTGSAAAINNQGAIVGNYCINSSCQGFLLEKKGLTGLGAFSPVAVNSRTQIAGNARSSGGQTHAFLWENGTARDLGTVPGTVASFAQDINESGQVVGEVSPDPFFQQPRIFMYQNGVMQDLAIAGEGAAVNAMGVIVGVSRPQPFRAIAWNRGTLTQLPGGGLYVRANDINDRSFIVGESYTPNTKTGLLWIDNQPYSLTTLTDHSSYPNLQVTNAYAITARGAILAAGCKDPYCTLAGRDPYTLQLLLIPISNNPAAP